MKKLDTPVIAEYGTITAYETCTYPATGTLALILYCEEEGALEVYGKLSVALIHDPICGYGEEERERLFRLNHDIASSTVTALEDAGLIKARKDIPPLPQGYVMFDAYEFLGEIE